MAKKLYYKIGEACKILDIQPYVLRYWEKEFPLLSPTKSRSGQRVYNERELGIIRRIKELLYEEGYTIAGAKKKLESELAGDETGGETSPAPAGGERTADSRSVAESAGGGKEDATPFSERPEAAPAAAGPEALDRLRSGVEEALGQARRILARLESAGT